MNANGFQYLALDDPRFALTEGKGRPDFMLIGAMKCGTSSFARYLSAHPQVKQKGPKEPQYWSWRRYPVRYQDFFVNETTVSDPLPTQYLSGDFSTSYMVHPIAPRRIRANLPDLKILVLLRNPVDRAYSHFIMSKRAGLENQCSFDAIVRKEIEEVPEMLAAHERGFVSAGGNPESYCTLTDGDPIRVSRHERGWPKRTLRDDLDLRDFYYKSYVFRSIYHDQLHRWLRLFPKSQMMIIHSERFFENPASTMNSAAGFLGLSSYAFDETEQLGQSWDAGAGHAPTVPGDYPPMENVTRQLLADFFAPHNERLYGLIGEDYGWS